MRFVDEVRDVARARMLAARIAELCEPGRAYRFVELCGGQRHIAYQPLLAGYLPDAVTLVPGPGCPVCALPAGRFDEVRHIAAQPGVVVASYADMTAEPHTVAGVKRVHSPLDALTIARHNGALRVVFWATGFEDTTPSTAVALIRAVAEGVRNFWVLCDHLRLPVVLDGLAGVAADGFIVPAQVSMVVGGSAYAGLGRPVVVAGPEPLDVLQALPLLLRQVRDGRREVENPGRAAAGDGNRVALRAIAEVLEPGPGARMRIRAALAAYDAAVSPPLA